MTLEYRQLGKTVFRVSAIGLGCVTFGREIDAASSFQVLDRAIERGVNLLDTAAVYGNGASEEVIGNWLRERATAGPRRRGHQGLRPAGSGKHFSLGRRQPAATRVEAIDLLRHTTGTQRRHSTRPWRRSTASYVKARCDTWAAAIGRRLTSNRP